MKILIVHNYYKQSSPSGENIIVNMEVDALRKKKNQVLKYSKFNDHLKDNNVFQKIKNGINCIYNFSIQGEFKKYLKFSRPDIIHIHNTFPLISSSIIYSSVKSKIPVVLTAHNYRYFCANGLLLRNDVPCNDCLVKRSVLPGLIHRCYRKSFFATLPISLGIFFSRLFNLYNRVDKIIVMSKFQKNIFKSTGVSSQRLFIKTNFTSNTFKHSFQTKKTFSVVFFGRLTREKGLFSLIEAWSELGETAPMLSIFGEGKLELDLKKKAKGLNVEFLGAISHNKVAEVMAQSELLVVPSECYEISPLVIFEALSVGLPIAASRIGSIPELISDGINGALFKANSPKDIARVIRIFFTKNKNSIKFSANKNFILRDSEATNVAQLLKLYEKVISCKEKSISND